MKAFLSSNEFRSNINSPRAFVKTELIFPLTCNETSCKGLCWPAVIVDSRTIPFWVWQNAVKEIIRQNKPALVLFQQLGQFFVVKAVVMNRKIAHGINTLKHFANRCFYIKFQQLYANSLLVYKPKRLFVYNLYIW